ncbi:MAG TPA: cytochrome c biogenesis protein ResB [Ramlibacter sp.]|uniref:cytochrome c biogenesis protein ResB n=1 Tax=Ramlibacter sp. TaxID=1917967 RepID=UPI002CF22A46|nr:cytochrome c biogenesis protein ResB [Ramlibacter sp.]HVZ42378.1 cytochrome c biogenesis protein ResB [Ramlibacter sp.]
MTAATQGLRLKTGSQTLRSVLELGSSMRFAISLLTVICIASIIGTVLRQQEPAGNYVDKFGPFWADLFLTAHLNAVYSAPWFLLILAFLVASTSLCIARNAPKIVADLRSLKEDIREQSLKAFHHRAHAMLPGEDAEAAARRIGNLLAASGWKVRLQQRDGVSAGWMVAARAGAANKIGYLAAHSAIVLVCLGGLLDGDLIVRAQMLAGGKTPYRGSGMIADVSREHRLGSRNPTFRGNILVAEGTQSSTAILSQSDGVLLQELPFSIELKKFVVEHYSTGMPKLFASDIVVHDRETGEAVPARVEVNKPFSWRGIDIYQSSFDDGGSSVKLEAVPMDGSGKRFEIEGTIGGTSQLTKGQGNGAEKMTLEYTGLRVMNVEDLGGAEPQRNDVRKVTGRKTLRNVGPSVSYKLRDAAGQAREFNNYMLPVDTGEGVPVFLLGVRENPGDAFRYLRVPADEQGSMEGFFRLRAALADPALREEAVRRFAQKATDASRPELARQLAESTGKALGLFAGAETLPGKAVGGLQAVSDFLEAKVAEGERARASEVLVRILNGALFQLAQMSRERAGLKPLEPNDATQRFMTQAVLALSDIHAYPAPVAFQLKDFKQVQASVFQVTRSPGHYVVYLGCALLILGVFAMLYIRERRLWVWLGVRDGTTEATMALSTNRKTLDTDREFARLKQALIGVNA